MNVVTAGGVTIGLGLLILRIGVWWPGRKRLTSDPIGSVVDILPFVYAWMYGVLAILCVGGVLGAAADVALWGANWIGDIALVWGVGGQAQHDVSRGTVTVLTDGGLSVTVLLGFVFVVLLKRRTVENSHLWQGVLSGITLGLSGSFAGAAAVPIASLVNLLGAWNTEVM